MKPASTSREDILKISRELVSEKGWNALNIRSMSSACGISIGCLYNYFSSKNDLVSATVESIWQEIFRIPVTEECSVSLKETLKVLYRQLEAGSKKYPGFAAMHSAAFLQEEREDGSLTMRKTWQQIKANLQHLIESDPLTCKGNAPALLSSEKGAEVLFSLILSSIVQENYDPSLILETADILLFCSE